ncbi:dentin sialophosphoprotein isoform X2 [Aplysia californica]|uniref:Dentin sialophosphoprotein isoform X2 n=1 Tax=Aplysia californica TaxID=6500 RepID=A0ABM0K419_APLCA|nr:dentin sialophosphoprotein isoform X2 [Aplysia californica]
MFRNVFSGCVSDRSSQAEVFRSQKLKFGASLSSALKHGYLPGPLVDILVFIAKEGVATADVFRRPGNPNDTRRIVKRLTEGKQVIYSNYSFYTLASVVKKFLLKIPGGVFTPEGEEQLLQVLTLPQKMEQIEAVHSFIETLSPTHQQLVALLFGTWFRIVTYSEVNCMSVEALSRSVAGSMFHTCAEDPAKVEKASRIMQFLIDNFGVEGMFGRENIRFFAETTHTGIHIRELYRYSYHPDSQLIPPVRSDFIEVTRVGNAKAGDDDDEDDDDDDDEDGGLGHEREFSQSPEPSPGALRHHADLSHDPEHDLDQSEMINMSTLSAPEVSLVPSPEVSKRPKSLEDNLNEVRSHYQSRCLSRFNSVKRKQLERLRQRSDWFLSPTVRERNNSRKGKGEGSLSLFANSSSGHGTSQHHHRGNAGCGGGGAKNGGGGGGNGHNSNNSNNNNNPNGSSMVLQQKNSGTSVVTKASSEGAVLEAFSDGDSVFTDNTSRSESPASEPVWSHILKVHSRDIIHSDTIAELSLPEMSLCCGDAGGSGADISITSHDITLGADATTITTATASLASPLRTTAGDGVRVQGAHHHDDDCDQDAGVRGDDEGGDDGDDDDDDEDNTTPTGIQEEEDTLMAASLQDIHHTSSSAGEDSSTRSEELDKDSPAASQVEATTAAARIVEPLPKGTAESQQQKAQQLQEESGAPPTCPSALVEAGVDDGGKVGDEEVVTLGQQSTMTQMEEETEEAREVGSAGHEEARETSQQQQQQQQQQLHSPSEVDSQAVASPPTGQEEGGEEKKEEVVQCFLVERHYGQDTTADS